MRSDPDLAGRGLYGTLQAVRRRRSLYVRRRVLGRRRPRDRRDRVGHPDEFTDGEITTSGGGKGKKGSNEGSACVGTVNLSNDRGVSVEATG